MSSKQLGTTNRGHFKIAEVPLREHQNATFFFR